MVSQIARGVFGDGRRTGFYYVIQAMTALILILAANTAYQDFPRLSSILARDRFAPRQLANIGDRLVFSNGILTLSLRQRRLRQSGWKFYSATSAFGGTMTLIVAVVIASMKFAAGPRIPVAPFGHLLFRLPTGAYMVLLWYCW